MDQEEVVVLVRVEDGIVEGSLVLRIWMLVPFTRLYHSLCFEVLRMLRVRVFAPSPKTCSWYVCTDLLMPRS